MRPRYWALLLAAGGASLAAAWLLQRAVVPGRLEAQLLSVRTATRTGLRLEPPPIQDVGVVEVLTLFEVRPLARLPRGTLIYGEMRVGAKDPAYLYLAGEGYEPNTAEASFRGEVALRLDGEQNSGLTHQKFIDVLRSDDPIALRIRAWDGEHVLAESDWIDFAPLRQRLTSLLR